MKKPKSIFYLIYFLFHVLLLGVSIYVNYRSEDFEFLLKLRNNMSLMIYVSVAGLILFGVNMILISMESRNSRKVKEKLESEVNNTKAKMYDMQGSKPSEPDSSKSEKPESEKSPDKDS